MPLHSDVYKAILAMDSYNRGYDASLNPPAGSIGRYTIGDDSVELLGAPAQAASFFAQSYTYNGETVISYRGTDNPNPLDPNGDPWNGYGIAVGNPSTPQGYMAAEFYRLLN